MTKDKSKNFESTKKFANSNIDDMNKLFSECPGDFKEIMSLGLFYLSNMAKEAIECIKKCV